jgi:hypothetical protein
MSSLKKPNVKAPRYRAGRDEILNKEFFDDMRRKVFAAKDMSDSELKNIIERFNVLLWNTVVDTRDGVLLPHQLGHVFIGTCPKKKSDNVDYKKSAEYDKTIQQRNWETDDYVAKIFYTSHDKKFRLMHKELWWFKPIRNFKRTVSKVYPERWKMYIEVDPYKRISSVFKKAVEKIEVEETTEISLETYNEFEL